MILREYSDFETKYMTVKQTVICTSQAIVLRKDFLNSSVFSVAT